MWSLRLIQVPAGMPGWQELVADCDVSLQPVWNPVSHFHLLHLQRYPPNLRDTALQLLWHKEEMEKDQKWSSLRVNRFRVMNIPRERKDGTVPCNASAWGDFHASAFVNWALEKSAQLSTGLQNHQAEAGGGLCCHSSHGDGKLHWRTVHRNEVLGAVPSENAVVAVHL